MKRMKKSPQKEKVQMTGMVDYNHALFESMAQFCDAVLLIELKEGTIKTLHNRLFPLMIGRTAPLSSVRDFVLRFMSGHQAEELISRLSPLYLQGLRQSISYSTGIFLVGDQPHNLHYTMTPEYDGYNRVVRVYLTFLDMQVFMENNGFVKETEQPDGGEQLAAMPREISDEIVANRARQRTLTEALMAAEQANKAKTVFLNNMSHDIRTPMNAIVGYTTLAIAHMDEPELVADYLSKIKTSSDHLLSLINDILDMSRIESGKMKLDETEVSLPELMNDLQNIVREEMNSKKLELFFDTVDVTNEVVWCDRLRLNQILLNCISNAVKYTPAYGSVGIRVIQEPGSRPDRANYVFKVLDTGIGMSDEFAKHIFEPFSREETSTVNGIQGTGLGMAITKNLVDMLGGDISVITRKGKGTEFTIRLTLRIAVKGIHQDFIIDSLWNNHALVVAANPDTCISVTDMLANIGLRAEWTASPREALLRTGHASRRGDPYELYIIDDALPDMSGIELARTIRSGETVKSMIILTSHDRARAETKALDAGINVICTKPLFMSKLHDTIRRALEKTPAEEAGKPAESPSLEGLTILLTEDNELNQEIAVTLLTDAGAAVDVAGNGSLAVERITAEPEDKYDLILMDIQMPVMNGYEATKAIRELPGAKGKIPIIAMTADAFREDKLQAISSGMNAHIPKPISMDVLADTIREVLNS
ncbi:MAG: response regulator [Selenomonadaceae bacterium]|nr:response regulator [Selenomonadaceae bacterium]